MTTESNDDEAEGWEPSDERAERMSRMRAQGASLQEIADVFSLTRERVRQIIRDAGGPSREEASAARRARAEDEQRALREAALRVARDHPGSTVEGVAERLGVTTGDVRAALGDDARRVLVSTHRPPIQFSDDEILGHLVRAAALAGSPLTVRMYDDVRVEFGGASSPLVLQRFGSWRQACTRAGVTPGQPLRSSYQRRWTRSEMVAHVAAYLTSDGSRGSFADYEAWARSTKDAPSGQTIRTQLGSWSQAKTEALALIAEEHANLDAGPDGEHPA